MASCDVLGVRMIWRVSVVVKYRSGAGTRYTHSKICVLV
jgi:hypothetical protein